MCRDPPDLHRDGPRVADDAAHLFECASWVREEHQGRLAEHGVEGVVREGQVARVTTPPVELGTEAAGDGQHRLVDVDPHHPAAGCDPVGRLPRHNAGPACDIKDRMAYPDAGLLDDQRRPFRKQGWHEPALIGLGGLQ